MSFIDDLKHWARGDEDEDEEELEEEEFVAPAPAPSRPEPDNDRAERAARRNNKVVNINTTTQLSVVLVKPEKFENAAEIADNLRQRRTVVRSIWRTPPRSRPAGWWTSSAASPTPWMARSRRWPPALYHHPPIMWTFWGI